MDGNRETVVVSRLPQLLFLRHELSKQRQFAAVNIFLKYFSCVGILVWKDYHMKTEDEQERIVIATKSEVTTAPDSVAMGAEFRRMREAAGVSIRTMALFSNLSQAHIADLSKGWRSWSQNVK